MGKQPIVKIADGVEYSDYPEYLVFRVMKKVIGQSASGKTNFYANTHGWKTITDKININIMVGKKVISGGKPATATTKGIDL